MHLACLPRTRQSCAASILESITDGFVALDREWRYTHINAEAERINGVPRGEQIGKTLWEVFPATRGTTLEFRLRQAVTELRDRLGTKVSLGVAAMGPRMCRLGGEIADLVLLNWMTPERMVWAREQVRQGAAGRARVSRRDRHTG